MNWPRVVLSVAAVAFVSTIALTAESQLTAVRYRVAVIPSDVDASEVARTLAATVRGRIEPYAEQGFDGFVVVANSSSAEILMRDPRVASVTILPNESIVQPSAVTQSLAAGTTPVATEQLPQNVTTNANDLLIGPYAYDGAGNPTEIGTNQDQFRYDAFGRLKTSTVSGVVQEYTYDLYGNLDSVKTNGTTATIGVDSATNRLKSTGAYNILGQYDAAGRMTGYLGRDAYSYDALDMVKESIVQNQRKVYLYTASDERLASVTINSGAETTSSWTVRDAGGNVLRAYDKTMAGGEHWSWKDDYVYRENQLLAAEVDTSAKTLHFHADHLGTPRLITANGGATVARHDYQPFGTEITPANQDNERMKFTGHERDFASGTTSDPIDYMHARYYIPSAGRFTSADPAMNAGAMTHPQMWNRYSYVMNNPLNFTDPTGRVPCMITVKGDDAKILGVKDGTQVEGECVERKAPPRSLFSFNFPYLSYFFQRRAEKAQPNKSTFTPSQCRSLFEVVMREAREGTARAAARSSNTWGDRTIGQFNVDFNTRGNPTLNNGAMMDVDWFTDISTYTGNMPSASPAAYVAGKSLWHAMGGTQGWPFQDPGEVTAVAYASRGASYNEIYNQACP